MFKDARPCFKGFCADTVDFKYANLDFQGSININQKFTKPSTISYNHLISVHVTLHQCFI